MKTRHMISYLSIATVLSGCASTMDRLENVGKQPPLSKVANPQTDPQYERLSWPMPDPEPPIKQQANSLWQPGARGFYRDNRASRVGDILRVSVEINDTAQLDNQTKRDRVGEEKLGAPDVFGMEGKLGLGLPGKPNPSSLFDISGDSKTEGKGTINRKEKITTQVAAIVTQVLPNGNLAIDGSQEIRVNYEVREIGIKGVVRPQDISSDNTISSSQVAEARITYGGRGQITDLQQPRWGTQVIDAVSPF